MAGKCVEKLPTEVWEDVPHLEGYYHVSSLGRVRSVSRRVKRLNSSEANWEGSILKPYKKPNGYLEVTLSVEGERLKAYVHRLVAYAFLPRTSKDTDVNHIDEVKDNNCISNLEWCTRIYNVEHSLKKVHDLVCPDGDIYHVVNLRAFSRAHKLDASCLCKVAKGKLSHHKGWRVLDVREVR